MPLLGSLDVAEFMARPRVVLSGRTTAADAAAELSREGLPGAPVADERGALIGVVRRTGLEETAADNGEVIVGRLADPTAPTTTTSDQLESALESLLATGTNWIPVLDHDRQVVGILTTSSVVRGYRTGLRANLRQISQVAGNTSVVDRQVADRSPLAGVALRQAGLPPGTIVMTLLRGSELLLPRGDTVLEPGDRVGMLTRAEDADRVDCLLREPEAGGGEGDADGGDDTGAAGAAGLAPAEPGPGEPAPSSHLADG